MNRPFITLLLCIIPFPVTLLADDLSTNNTQIINQKPCKRLQINQKNGEKHTFCMTKVDQEIRQSGQDSKTMKQFSLFTSDNQTANHHGAKGNIGFAVIEYIPNRKQTLIHEEVFNIPLGSFGKAPTEFSFQQFGMNNYGYIIENSINYQGVESGGIQIIGENNGQIFQQYIPTFFDDFSYHGDQSIAETLTYTLSIEDHKTTNKMFPIKITLNGKYEGVEYHQQTFLFHFDEKQHQYIKPDNYPTLY